MEMELLLIKALSTSSTKTHPRTNTNHSQLSSKLDNVKTNGMKPIPQTNSNSIAKRLSKLDIIQRDKQEQDVQYLNMILGEGQNNIKRYDICFIHNTSNYIID